MRLKKDIEPVTETKVAVLEFGTGLRARLEPGRLRAEARLRAQSRPARHDISPELMLVSPESAADLPWAGLAELLLEGGATKDAPLGALLADAGLLEQSQINSALIRARASGQRLGEVLVEHGLVDPAEIVRLVAAQYGLPFVDLHGIAVDPTAAKLLPEAVARRLLTLPVGFARGLPVVALADPTDEDAIDATRSVLHCVRFVASAEDAMLAQFARVYYAAELAS